MNLSLITRSLLLAAIVLAVSSKATEAPAQIWIAGDVNLGDGGRGQGISSIVQGAVGIVNLEGPVATKRDMLPGKTRLWNSPESIGELIALNVKGAGVENNHMSDAGLKSRDQTALALAEKGILAAGTAVIKIGSVRIVVIARDLTNGAAATLPQDLAAARKLGDQLIATFHVTGPPSYIPRSELRRAVEFAYQAGASVIVAHGTHVIGPVERRERGIIAWGLGNVAFACRCTTEQDAILIRVSMQPGQPVKAEVFPIRAGVNGMPAGPSKDAPGILKLLEAIGSSRMLRRGDSASF